MRAALTISMVLVLAGCDPDPGADAGGFDAGPADDAGASDGGGVDAGDRDSGSSDGGSDAGSSDGGSDAGSRDSGVDSGAGDGGVSPPMCVHAVGRRGGLCRMGTACVTGLTCYAELSIMGMPLTLGNTFGIRDGAPDPANPGEFLAGGPSTVRIHVTPGGLCTEGCATGAVVDTCGACGQCSENIGGTDAFGAVGITVRTFDVASIIGAGEDGVCRGECNFDPLTNGGCPTGHTCQAGTNICVEECVNNEQCNLSWGDSRAEGLVATRVPANPFTCSAATRRCAWTPPPTAAFGTACNTQADCPANTGVCYFGRCTTVHCADSTGVNPGASSCPMVGAACIGTGGNNGSLCLGLCNTAADCAAEHACDPLTVPLADGAGTMWNGTCVGPCSSNAECRASRRCDAEIPRFSDPTLGVCESYCDPTGGGLAGAVACAVGEACVGVAGQPYGFCRAQNNLCLTHEACFGGQRCRVLGNDLLGRCEASCAIDADCTGTERCVIVDSDPTDGVAETRGVCIPPGGACSPSPRTAMGAVIQLLRGLDGSAQCVPGQRCNAPTGMGGLPVEDALATCVP